MKKKTLAVVAAAAIGSVAVGGAAWAWIASSGTGSGTATANATAGTVTLSATASITDLDTPAAVAVSGSSDQNNRHISSVTIAINSSATLPTGCDPAWFKVRQGTSGSFATSVTVPAPHTFATAGATNTNIVPDVFVQLENAEADQSSCVNNASLTNLLTLTAS